MKRKLTLLLACLMALTMALTGAAESLSPVGSWTLTGVEAEGMTLDPAMLGMEITMTLNEDGTAQMGMSGLVEEGGTWSVEGDVVTVIDPDGEEMPMTFTEDGSLRAEQDGMAMIFTLSTGDEGQSVIGAAAEVAVLEDVALEDFNGEWTATHGLTMGIEVPLETLGLTMDVSMTTATSPSATARTATPSKPSWKKTRWSPSRAACKCPSTCARMAPFPSPWNNPA